MKVLPHLLAAFSIVATAILLLFTGLVWAEMQERLSIVGTLKANIAEMARIDEVLTTSALLATATGDTAYRDRYQAHVDVLDDLLKVSIGLFDSDRAERMLERTRYANDWLVATEERALDAMGTGPNPRAYAELRSDQYARHKAEYVEGLDAAMGALETLAHAGVDRMKGVLARLAAIVALAALCFVRVVFIARREHRRVSEQDERLETMQGLLRTFMDLQNNLLNNMVYLRTKAAYAMPFDDDDIRMIDAEIDKAKSKLTDIVDSGIGSTRDLGGVVVLDTGSAKAAGTKRERDAA